MTNIYSYLYFRENDMTRQNDIIKCGISKDPLQRNNNYITYELKRGKFIKVIKVSRNIIYNLDKTVKDHFQYLNIYYDAGTEYFQLDIINYIEPLLQSLNVKFTVMTDEELIILEHKCVLMEKLKNINKKRLIDILLLSHNNVIPYNYQCNVLKKLKRYFIKYDVGKLIWSCGIGKTITSILACKVIQAKIILIGVPTTYLQTQMLETVLQIFPNKENILLVGGESVYGINRTVNKDKIGNFIDNNTNMKIIITTYKSCYKLLDLSFDIKIGDECHHLSGVEKDESFTSFHKIHSKKTLFMTATEKVIESKNKVYCFIGDMTSETGIAHETIKYSINKKLPIHFIIEDNTKSVCTDTKKAWSLKKLTNEKINSKYITYYKYKLKYPHAGAGKRVQF